MSDLNIDEFYRDVAQTLASLYRMFPRPVTVFVEDIAGPDEPDEYGVHSHRYQACFAAFLWLGEEGYIRYNDTIRSDAIDQAVLTGRCFAALLSPVGPPSELADQAALPPSVAAQQRTLIYALNEALKAKSSLEIEAAVQPLLKRMI